MASKTAIGLMLQIVFSVAADDTLTCEQNSSISACDPAEADESPLLQKMPKLTDHADLSMYSVENLSEDDDRRFYGKHVNRSQEAAAMAKIFLALGGKQSWEGTNQDQPHPIDVRTEAHEMYKLLEAVENSETTMSAVEKPSRCGVDTETHCEAWSCASSVGPAVCTPGSGLFSISKCVCNEGYCANNDGVCILQIDSLNAEVVRVNDADASFPKAQDKMKLGVTFSGGGIRATAWALGGLRKLEEWGFMNSVDVVNGVSGGAWANAIYMFARNNTTEILGGPTKPEELTMSVLNQPSSGIKTCTNNWWKIWADLILADRSPPSEVWQRFVCKAFLEPFGQCDFYAFMANSEEHVQSIKDANPGLNSVRFQYPRPDRPKVFLVEGTMFAPVGSTADPAQAVNIQFGTEYIGIPYYPNQGTINYQGLPNVRIGGGLVSSVAFGGTAPSAIDFDGKSGQVKVGAPYWPFSLARAIGISSMSPGGKMSDYFLGRIADPEERYWSVPAAGHNLTGSKLHVMADGGDEENSGMIPLLQRKVPKIVWFAASYKLINQSYPLCEPDGYTDNSSLAYHSGIIDQVLDKFGFGDLLNISMDNALSHNQVFHKSELQQKVACPLKRHVENGTPPVVRFDLEVKNNSWWGIPGGWNVSVILVYLAHSTNFTNKLPNETRAEVERGEKGLFANYPIYTTTWGRGDPAAYSLLAATSEYFVGQNKPLFTKLVEDVQK